MLFKQQTHDEIVKDFNYITSQGAGFGAKIVRGAYLEHERSRAKLHGYGDPVHDNFDATTAMYSKSVKFLLDRVKLTADRLYFIIATHNKDSVHLARQQCVILLIYLNSTVKQAFLSS